MILLKGASSGIGAATAVLFSKLGASLALTGRKENNLALVGADCEKEGEGKVTPYNIVSKYIFLLFPLEPPLLWLVWGSQRD